jgi:hypothetical protein
MRLSFLHTYRFLEGDLMLHNTEITIRNKQSADPEYIHASTADASTKAWRKWWANYGLSSTPRNTFGPASPENLKLRPRHELVDPWHSHTKHCSKCRDVLQRSKLIQKAGWAVLWGSLAIYRRNSFMASTMGFLGLLSSRVAGRVVRELEGTPNKSEVGDRSLSASK